MEADPFPGLNIAAGDFLDASEGRSSCPKCGKSRKYYCYTCYVAVAGNEDKVPRVTLPIKVDIIKHPSECDGKSTAAHAGVLAPDDVRVYTYPVIPDYTDRSKVLLVFPGEHSVTIEELAQQYREAHSANSHSAALTNSAPRCPNDSHVRSTAEELPAKAASDGGGPSLPTSQTTSCKRPVSDVESESPSVKRLKPDSTDAPEHSSTGEPVDSAPRSLPYERVVFIDSTWNQTKKIFCDERLKDLTQVELKTQMTRFWRHQRDKPKTYLATIEAIYFFIREFHEAFVSPDYDGQYDNLLFFFSFMYHKIRGLYSEGKELKAYK